MEPRIYTKTSDGVSIAYAEAGVRFEDCDEQAMKGVADPLRVWAVVFEG